MLESANVDRGSFAYLDIIGQDRWSEWTPVFTSLTTVGALTAVGRFRIVGRSVQFQARFSAATSIASTAGTTYFASPRALNGYVGAATMMNLTTNIAVGVCVVDVANSRIYLPTQAASGNTFGVAGWAEI